MNQKQLGSCLRKCISECFSRGLDPILPERLHHPFESGKGGNSRSSGTLGDVVRSEPLMGPHCSIADCSQWNRKRLISACAMGPQADPTIPVVAGSDRTCALRTSHAVIITQRIKSEDIQFRQKKSGTDRTISDVHVISIVWLEKRV
jgi:hypothetical protein